MTRRDANTAFATALADEWARAGLRHAIVAPGSRSTPLALALAREPRLRVDVVLDERSAGFRALGLALGHGEPVVVLCTSGTAAANLHPAVLEAHHARVPLIVCTADRPPELHDVGAGQTVDQHGLYGGALRWSCDPGLPTDVPGAATVWRTLACRAVAVARGPVPGPVHLNLAFREPLVPTGVPPVDAPGRADGRPFVASHAPVTQADDAAVDALVALVTAHPRGVVAAGWGSGARAETVDRFAAAAGWPVLADAISNLRAGPYAVSTYERLVRDEHFAVEHRPQAVLRLGAPLTSKVANAWLAPVAEQLLVDPHDRWLDPDRTASHRVVVDADDLLARATARLRPRRDDGAWVATWAAAEAGARAALDAALDALTDPVEGRIARDLARALPSGARLLVASSLPVRALEWCMPPRGDVTVFANRGVNGIDGFVSTALGLATANPDRPTFAFCGDLCFLHDVPGLLTAAQSSPVTFVVVDNDGGGIFSFLPQAPLPEFEELFGTPHGRDLVAIAQAYGVAATRTKDPDFTLGAQTRVVVVPVDRAATAAVHRHLLGP